ncbi:MAG: DivIVA domain-containing protein [Bifidobacteriaceae bacterium]|jgi:DivIVA domain-containing protein|nr:DivIVA domain-containing protein [Bifidobacteriaceae bacterium]
MTILTLEDIKNVEFRPARLKEGYLADEVDKFIDDVIETFSSNKPISTSGLPAEPKVKEPVELDNSKITELQSKISQTEETLAKVQADKNDISQKLTNTFQELSNTSKELEETIQAKAQADKEIENLKAELVKAQAKNAQSSSDVLEEITNLTNEKEALLEKYNNLTNENDSLKKKFESIKNNNNDMSDNLKIKISELESELNIATMKFNKINLELESAVAENTQKTEEVIKLRKTIQMYEEEPKTGATQAIIEAGIGASSEKEVDQVSSMLLLATKLRDEYIVKARQDADETRQLASVGAEKIISEAENKSREIMQSLNNDRKTLEAKIEQLRLFEADYRSKILKQLNQLLEDFRLNSPNE